MELISKLKKLRSAAKVLRLSSVETRNEVLIKAALLLSENEREILKANAQDLKALPATTTPAFRDRLTLTSDRIRHMALSLRQVAALVDPLASKAEEQTLKNGLLLKKVRSPLGVIFMIFESRPNVAIEAFSMGFKSGNTMILRGGKESLRTTKVLYKVLQLAIESAGLPSSVL
ncbi:MAG: aldehyde dehydrogenase family protein, partial [Bdellovibrionaceae bacterium]|nr:aldehyde dehydrogenase family protein [Pseudobdellovibrionaceae bacterium]